MIVETGAGFSLPARRIPGVVYHELKLPFHRALFTRFHPLFASLLTCLAGHRHAAVERLAAGFQAGAVLTVAHGFGWSTAAAVAARRPAALHLIIHDDWPTCSSVPAPFRKFVHRELGRVYRQARSRFCASSFMRADYAARYGSAATQLYPSRAAGAVEFAGPPGRVRHQLQKPVVFFGGTINTAGYARSLHDMAGILAELNGRLVIHGPYGPDDAARLGLNLPNIEFRGLVSPEELLQRQRSEADILFIPMSFAPEDRENMRRGFPSKLADCTAAGLPILIQGPPDCSAVCWARENRGVAEVVDQPQKETLKAAVLRLVSDAEHRWKTAVAGAQAGARDFSHAGAYAIFIDGLTRSTGCPHDEL